MIADTAVCRPIWLPGGVAATLHPGTTSKVGTGVVLVPPFGWEDIASYRARREWSESLAAAGHPVVRIDLPGTGDSAGGVDRPQLLACWADAVAQAARFLRTAGGCSRVAVIGLGLGGVAACLAAAGDPTIDDLVLWSVPSRGRSMLRQLRAFAAMDDGASRASTDDGWLWLFGYPLPAGFLDELREFDVAELPLRAGGRRALVLGRDGIPPETRLVEALGRAGVSVSTHPGVGYAALVEHPQKSVRPGEVWAAVARWLDAPGRGPLASVAVVQAPDEIEVAPGIRERVAMFDTAVGRICAVVTTPDNPSTDLCLVLMNSGATRRTGPSRLWVQAARRAAAQGVTTVRWDVPGIGDTAGSAKWSRDWGQYYVRQRLVEVAAAMDALAGQGLGQRFLLGGLCSGAYWSFEEAQKNERVVGVVMLNPRAVVYPEVTDFADQLELGTALRVSSVRKVLTGEISRRQISQFAKGALRSRLSSLALRVRQWRSQRASGRPADRLAQALDLLERRGVPVTMVFESPDRSILGALRAGGYLDDPHRWSHLHVRAFDGAPGINTSFAPPELQEMALQVFDEVVMAAAQR